MEGDERNSRAARIRAAREFHSLQKGSLTVTEYMARTVNAAVKLRSLGKTIADEDIVDKILAGLPAEYDSLTILLDDKNDISLRDLDSLLLNVES
jgi:hypothetical protein